MHLFLFLLTSFGNGSVNGVSDVNDNDRNGHDNGVDDDNVYGNCNSGSGSIGNGDQTVMIVNIVMIMLG